MSAMKSNESVMIEPIKRALHDTNFVFIHILDKLNAYVNLLMIAKYNEKTPKNAEMTNR